MSDFEVKTPVKRKLNLDDGNHNNNLKTQICEVQQLLKISANPRSAKKVRRGARTPAHEKFCELCKKMFQTKHNLKTHINEVHERKKRFSCTTCKVCYFV